MKGELIMATTFLATVIGWYMVVFSFLILFRHEHVKSAVSDIMANRGLFFILAIMTFILGLLMVASHNIWVMGWPVIITVLSWLVLVSGIVRLFFPDDAPRMGRAFLKEPMRLNIAAIVILLIGLYLLSHVYYFQF